MRRSVASDCHVPPLRVALVAPPYFEVPPGGYGGVEAVVADLADALAAQGHHVTLLGAGRSTTRAEFVPLWPEPVPQRLGEPTPEIVHAAAARNALLQLADAGELDVVHDHTLAGPLNAAVLRRRGIPTVLTVHGPVDADMHRYYRDLGADVGLIGISHRQRELAPDLNWLGVVHNALRPEDWPFRAEKGDYALFLGRFHPQKAPHLALDAAHAAGVPLVLAGKCSEPVEQEYFDREVRPRLRSSDRLMGVADAKTKRELLAHARCLLFPIQWEEPFGMVMIEAMVCGTPVVALRGGAVAEVVTDGVTGLVCDHPDQLPAALAAVTGLNPHDCRASVIERFSADRMAEGYVAAYRQAITAQTQKATGYRPTLAADTFLAEVG
ncbi:glycosyltransferase family 4 protein [Blastococcus sp. KM273129]|uniref:glycosyltransferase family 4 protein n=1 Tax=Blastococcus sp. KM273129 TaxID=2570315 RepID=UPI001F30D78F|nr:glycosyltransferase family 4 protein [Blastococcus sp. KM273129]MCF6733674.1 glycosyltransferase family 4 protein [Blastococcus sp. KM273129]